MRKDVRLGFSVGALLLAVIIVAVLVIHRGKNNDKSVALDAGKSAAPSSNDAGPIDVGAKPAPDAQGAAVGGGPGDREEAAGPRDSGTSGASDAGARSGSQWDQLFQSTAADPIQAELSIARTQTRVDPPPERSTARRSDSPGRPGSDGNTGNHSRIEIDPPLPDPPLAPDSPRTHKLQAGETFMSVSKMVYGSSRYFKAIIAANPTLTPEKLKPGTVIQLPPAAQVKQSAKASRPPAPAAPSTVAPSANSKTYTVQKDDSLYKIARKLYGKGERSGELYTLNRSVIGPDSTRLKIGMVLTLPQASSAESNR
jgi:nucleoid-associated protein YgaU